MPPHYTGKAQNSKGTELLEHSRWSHPFVKVLWKPATKLPSAHRNAFGFSQEVMRKRLGIKRTNTKVPRVLTSYLDKAWQLRKLRVMEMPEEAADIVADAGGMLNEETKIDEVKVEDGKALGALKIGQG